MSKLSALVAALFAGCLAACSSESDPADEASTSTGGTGASTGATPSASGAGTGSTAGTGGDAGSSGGSDAGSGGGPGPSGSGGDGSGGDGSGGVGPGGSGAGGDEGVGGNPGAGGGAGAGVAFGANWQGTNVPGAIALCEAAGVTVERSSVKLEDYTGQSLSGIDNLIANGINPLVNVTWDGGGQGGSGAFVGDTPQLRAKLRSFLDRYGGELDVIVIENEPATRAFYDDDLNDYIAELKAAVEVIEAYREEHAVSPKIADGGVHVPCIAAYTPEATAVSSGGQVCERQNFLLRAYAEIPGLDFVTIHFSVGSGDGFGNGGIGGPLGLVDEDELLDASVIVDTVTGHPVLSNEWSTGVDTAASIESVVAAFRRANEVNGSFPFAVVFSGDGDSDALPLHTGTDLNALGEAYRDAVAGP